MGGRRHEKSSVQFSVLINGMSKKKAAREFGVPRGTLQRHIKNAEKGAGVKKQLGRKCILTEDQEEDLAARLVEMEQHKPPF